MRRASRSSRGLLEARRRRCASTTRWRIGQRAARSCRRRVDVSPSRPTRPRRGRTRVARRHRVERVPVRSTSSACARLMRRPVDLRRPQPLRARASCARSASTYHSIGRAAGPACLRQARMTGPASPAAPASSAHISASSCSIRAAKSSAMDNFIHRLGRQPGPASAPPPGLRVRLPHTSPSTSRSKGPIDWVLHFASPASPRDYLELPIPTLKVGALGTHVLGLAKAKQARFLLASTSEVLRRPARAPAARGLLGQRQPDRAARRVRRGQALRRAITTAYHRYSRPLPRASFASSTASPPMKRRWCSTTTRCTGVPSRTMSPGLERGRTRGSKIQVPAFDPETFRITLPATSVP